MKKLLFLFIALLSVTLLQAGQSIVIRGKITDCPNRDNASIRKFWFNLGTFQEESFTLRFPIAEDGTFRVKIPDANEFYAKYWLHLGNEGTLLELIAGDSLNVMVNANMFDESIRYTGRGGGRSNYRRDVALKFWENNSMHNLNSSDPSYFLSVLNTLRDQKLELLNTYFQSNEIDSSYYQYEKTLIMNEVANLVVANNISYQNHRYMSGSLKRQMEAIVKAADFSNDAILNNTETRELIVGLPGYMQQIDDVKPGADVSREIAFANTHYSKYQQLYFHIENIRRYLSNAPYTSQKKALLNYFDKQLNDPVLKREIQEQRNSLHSNRGLNSRFFQAAVMIIFWLLGMVVLIYGIIKLIQYLGTKRIKINLSLWLKIIFYLGAAMIAVGYTGNINAPLHGFPMVFLMLGAFLIHTYLLIPRYALQRDPRYFILMGAMLFVFVGGNMIMGQVLNSLFEFVVILEVFLGLMLLSWISYYIHQIASGKSTLKELRKNNDLNLEIAFHLLVVFLANLMFIASLEHYGIFRQVLLFYTILLLLYLHTFYTFPRYFKKEKALHFVGINLGILLGAALLLIVMDGLQSYQSLKDIGVSAQLSELFSVRNVGADLIIVFALLLIPSFVYYFIKKQLSAMESTGFSLYWKKEAELAQLKSQVNPHFLFNTLNTLYAFALKEGSDKTAECIAKLANLMRFMLDDMEKDTILLKREISYIRDYVKLQSIRSAVEHDIAINVEMEDEKSYSIAPMLLIPFVENAFKHGMNPAKVSRLKIDIRANDQQIQFVIENSIDDHFQAYYKEKGFGIGIENVKSRLRHVYPDRHTLSIAKTSDSFIVILTIGR